MKLYGQSMALLTDLYQLTMCYGYWQTELVDADAVFHLHFRKNPFNGGFTIACGLEEALQWLRDFSVDDSDVDYLATLTGADKQPLFQDDFLEYLRQLKWTVDIDAVPEGTVVFPYEPMVRVQGSLIQCQLLETAFLNLINFPSLIATKAARVCIAAKGEPVLEFGLRRAQGSDGGITASRAAYIGGCSATSNVLAGKMFGMPVKGTHAHSWVMAFDDELDSFQAYAEAMPNNCIFLVDTYDSLQGVKHAIEVGKWLRSQGRDMLGIRLDSGDLAYLSIQARKMLDDEGFRDAAIVASNDLDERIIESLKSQGAKIGVWGVGTRLATAYEQPALGGVYKMSAIRRRGGEWQNKIKLSEQTAKVSIPGKLQIRRFRDNGEYRGDLIYHEAFGVDEPYMIDPLDSTRRKRFPESMRSEDLLIPVYRQGKEVYAPPPVDDARQRAQEQLNGFHFGIKRFVNPHLYAVGLEKKLYDLRMDLVLEARGKQSGA